MHPFVRARTFALLLGMVVALGCLADATPQRRHAREQHGFATYYSRSFEGDETASGETFDGDELVAAHRTLPFDSVVQVTNLENGRRVRVRIIDRGPYGENWREGTIIDLSPAAARRIDMVRDGQVRVRLTVIQDGPRPRDPASD